jgi:hypothetical protein
MQYQRGSIGLFFRGDPTLKAWYPLDGTPSNLISSSAQLILYGSPAYYPDRKGGLSIGNFSPSNVVYTTDVAPLQVYNLTACAWIYMTSYSGNIINEQPRGTANDGRGYTIVVNTNGTISGLIGNASGSFTSVTSVNAIPLNKWVFVTFTYDHSALKIYINGKFEASYATNIDISYADKPGSYGPNPQTFYIGIGHNAYDSSPTYAPDLWYPLQGRVAEVAIFSRALSSQEISQYYRWATSSRPKLLYYDTTSTSYSTTALLSQLEKTLKSTTALAARLEGKKVDLVALLTELQYQGYSTAAIQTLLERVQQGDVALISELQRVIQDTLALKSTLRAKIWRREHYTPSQNWIKEDLHN